MKKLLIILVGILIMAGCTDKTEAPFTSEQEVKTESYINNDLNYQFDYNPVLYKTEETIAQIGEGEVNVTIFSAIESDSCLPEAMIYISSLSFFEELQDLGLRISGEPYDVYIGEINAIKFSGEAVENQPPCGNKRTDVIFEYNGQTYVMSAFEDGQELIDYILKTFKLN